MGTVRAASDGKPLAGVTVAVKGTSTGTVTNQNGNYELVVPEQAQFLVFSYVGMKNVETAIHNKIINISLEPDLLGLEEVVVIAY
ncbi:MAG: carboxypeptidase-like regulatory domain-containing protein [Mariniphaga sp.]